MEFPDWAKIKWRDFTNDVFILINCIIFAHKSYWCNAVHKLTNQEGPERKMILIFLYKRQLNYTTNYSSIIFMIIKSI